MENPSPDIAELYERLLAEKDARIADLHAALEYERGLTAAFVAGGNLSEQTEEQGKELRRRRERKTPIVRVSLSERQYGEFWPLKSPRAVLVVHADPDPDKACSYLEVDGESRPFDYNAWMTYREPDGKKPEPWDIIKKFVRADLDQRVYGPILDDWGQIADHLKEHPREQTEAWSRHGAPGRMRYYRQVAKRIEMRSKPKSP